MDGGSAVDYSWPIHNLLQCNDWPVQALCYRSRAAGPKMELVRVHQRRNDHSLRSGGQPRRRQIQSGQGRFFCCCFRHPISPPDWSTPTRGPAHRARRPMQRKRASVLQVSSVSGRCKFSRANGRPALFVPVCDKTAWLTFCILGTRQERGVLIERWARGASQWPVCQGKTWS